MALDAAKYKNSVLVPLAKDKARLEVLQQVIRDLQGAGGIDAAARLNTSELFAVATSMTSQELAGHLKSLEMTYNKQKHLPSAQLLKTLLELFGKAGKNVADPAFWAGLGAERGQALKGQLDEFAQTVAQEHSLKVVTPAQLSELAAGVGLGDLSEADLTSALSTHGVDVQPDFEIPRVALPAAVRKVRDFPEFRTIVDVVVRPEQPMDMSVIEELTYGSPARRLEPNDVVEAKQRLQQQEAQVEERARQAAQNALGALTDLKSASELHALTLAALAETAEDLIRRGLPRVTVRNQLVKRGVRQVDASRLVNKLSASTQVLDLNDVAERLADGALGEARRLLDALPHLDGEDPAERARMTASVEAAERKKSSFLAQYDSALKGRDYIAAATALRGALCIDTEDDDLRQKLARLPPLPPASISLRVDGRTLGVTWSADGEDTVRYSVVRTMDEVPINQKDGDVLASSVDATRFRDEKPPIGRKVRYAVFATRDGVSFSDPATATAIVLPAPFELGASPGTTDVSLSWATPPEAAGVVITQTAPDGSRVEHRPTTPGQVSVTGLATGTKYRFSAKAIYLLSGGERRESAAVEIDATPRGSIRAVEDLRIEVSATGHRAIWSTVVGYTVELWAIPITAQLRAGTRVSNVEFATLRGQRLTLRPSSAPSGFDAREFNPLPDVSVVVPVTLEGDGGLVGRSQVAGSAPSVQKPTAERFGDELRLSWEWPRGDYMIEVGWAVRGARNSRRVSRTAYNDDGGVRIPHADSVRDVTLATVVRAGAQEWVSPPLPVPVGGVAPAVTYSLVVKRSRLGGKGTATVTVESPKFRGRVQALTILKEAKFMPSRPSDGTVVDRRVLDFTSGPSVTFTLVLGKVASPFWVRLFPEVNSSVRVEDPPTSQMRG
jgi:hypothetical protein